MNRAQTQKNAANDNNYNHVAEKISHLSDDKHHARRNLFRDFIDNMANDKDGGKNTLKEIGRKAYGRGIQGNDYARLKGRFFEYFEAVQKDVYDDMPNTDQEEMFRKLLTGGKYSEESLQTLFGTAKTIEIQEDNLAKKIEKWYDVGTPGQMTQGDIEGKISTLTLSELNQAIRSISRLTSLIRQWHKELINADDVVDFQDKKKERIKEITDIAGIPNSEADSFIEKIDNNEVNSDDLFTLINKFPNSLSSKQKVDIFQIVKPTLTLQEIHTLSKNHGIDIYDHLIKSLVADHIHTHGGTLGITNADEPKLRNALENMFHKLKYIEFPASILFQGVLPNDMARFYDDMVQFYGDDIAIFFDKNIDQDDEKWNKKEKIGGDFVQNEIQHSNSEANENGDGRTVYERLENVGIHLDEKTNPNPEGMPEIINGIVRILKEKQIANADNFGNIPTNIDPVNREDSYHIIFRKHGRTEYIELLSIGGGTNGDRNKMPRIRYISHTDTQGGYSKNDDIKEVDIDAFIKHLSSIENARQKEEANSIIPKHARGTILSTRELKNDQRFQEKTPDNLMDINELENRLYELDREKIKIEKGVLIETMSVDRKKMLIEILEVNETTGTISINMVNGSTDTVLKSELNFQDFLKAFDESNARRIGKAGNVEQMLETLKRVKKPADFKHIKFLDGKLRFVNQPENQDFAVGRFQGKGQPPDHIFIDTFNPDGTVTFIYTEGWDLSKYDDQKEEVKTEPKKKITYKNAPIKFLMEQLMYMHDGKWDPRKEHENVDKKAHEHGDHDEHHDHPPHYHGGPLQWLAHSKNFGHLFKGIGMAFGELKHFIEHGDEHVAKEMEYNFISWMRKNPALSKFMPEEIYLDLKSDIESKKLKTIQELQDKWGGLSTGDVGKMAVALLADSYTTVEQLFGIIFALNKKTGNLYGVGSVQQARREIHVKEVGDPVPIFLWKLCVITGYPPIETIKKMQSICGPGGSRAYEGGRVPVPEMYLIQVFSHTELQKQTNPPPPVPGSFHAKIFRAWNGGEDEQKKAAFEGEANQYATQDQIKTRMYALLGDGEIAQAVGFYERLIPRGAPLTDLMGLPFAILTSGARDLMSHNLIRSIHIQGVYEHGFATSMLTALESQTKYNNFQQLLQTLATKDLEVNGKSLLTPEEKNDLAALLNFKIDLTVDTSPEKKGALKNGESLAQKSKAAAKFWSKHGEKLMKILDLNDDDALFYQIANKYQDEHPSLKNHLNLTQERTEGRNFEAKPASFKNNYYDYGMNSFNFQNPREGAESFKPNSMNGKYGTDDSATMHEKIFLQFEDTYKQIRSIAKGGNDPLAREKFYEITFHIYKKITNLLGDDVIKQLDESINKPEWYIMLQKTIGFNKPGMRILHRQMGLYHSSDDARFRKLVDQEYAYLIDKKTPDGIQGSVGGTARKIIDTFGGAAND